MKYRPAREYWAHQGRIFGESRDAPVWGLFMEQGTGKSKVMVDTVCWNYLKGRIDAALIVCDKGILRTWAEEHIPENMSPDIAKYDVLTYDAARSKSKRASNAQNDIVDYPGLAIVLTNWAAFRTEAGRNFLKGFLRDRSVIMLLDESDAIKTPNAKQTRAITTLGKQAVMRRIATGTPAADKPFDVFSQMRFLDPSIIGISSFVAFKHEFGVWEKGHIVQGGRVRDFPRLAYYQDLDRLHTLIDAASHRVLKEECLDLPPKVYERLHVESSQAQRKALSVLRRDAKNGDISPLIALTRATQIAAGFMIRSHGKVGVAFPEQPKAAAIVRELQRMKADRQAIVWCQFIAEVDIVVAALKQGGISCTQYTGVMDMSDRDWTERHFIEGNHRVIVATVQSASKGRNWQNASAVFYHSNSPKLVHRMQSEDRAHRIGTKHAVTYYDICAEGTRDEKRLEALRGKRDVVSIVNGDNIEEWI